MNLSNQEKIDILRISKKIFICIVRHTGKDLDKLSRKLVLLRISEYPETMWMIWYRI